MTCLKIQIKAQIFLIFSFGNSVSTILRNKRKRSLTQKQTEEDLWNKQKSPGDNSLLDMLLSKRCTLLFGVLNYKDYLALNNPGPWR